MTFEGEWTQVIGIGTYELDAGTRYRFASGSFRVAGDDTVYGGDQYFYLPADGTYSVGGGA